MSKYTSNAEWPDTVNLGCTPNDSTDTHESKEFAEAVCRRLNLTHGWRLIYRVLGWMAAQYELDDSWEPGLMLYEKIRRAANL